ncbi:MAG: DUF3761 domain-containing protein [Patescibacteria group bacterium]
MFNKISMNGVKWLILPLLFLFGAGCSGGGTANNVEPGLSIGNQSETRIANEYFEPSRLQVVVRDFFNNIDLHNYSVSYGYFSGSFKAAHPFKEWSDGYKETLGHAISDIQCDKNECIVNLIATEISEGVIQKQNFVFNYAFIKSEKGEPLINSGVLRSSKIIEVVKNKKISDDVLKNLSYPSGSFLTVPFHLIDGVQKFFDEKGNETGFAAIDSSLAHGDVNGDGYEDAVVSIRVNTGGTGIWPLVYLVINKNGTPTPYIVTNPQLEDRDQINSVAIQGNKVTFNLTVHGLSDPSCCPSVNKIEDYKVVNNQLILVTPVQPLSASDGIYSNDAPSTYQAATQPAQQTAPEPTATYAPNGTYENVYGNEVPSPYEAPSIPAGASAQCGDGTYSFSQSRRGTCSHHGGVGTWY